MLILQFQLLKKILNNKNGEPMNTKIVDFKSIYSEMISGLTTIDFWSDDFLKDIAENNYCSSFLFI